MLTSYESCSHRRLGTTKSQALNGLIPYLVFIHLLQNYECQAEPIGLAGEPNSRIMLSQIKQKLRELHRIEYFKSVQDDNDSISGLSNWLFRQQILMEKSKSSMADTMEPKRVSKSLSRTSGDVNFKFCTSTIITMIGLFKRKSPF